MSTGFVQRFKGAIFGTSRSQFLFGAGLGLPITVAGNIDQQTGAVGNGNDATEDTLFTKILPPNSFNANSRGLFITVFGSLANNAHTKTVKAYFGSGVVYTLYNGTGVGAWWGELMVVRSGSKTQYALGQSVVGAVHQGISNVLSGVEDDTAAITLKLTGQTATANPSDVVGNVWQVTAFN